MNTAAIKQEIEAGKTVLGIEFGSTRIKAVLIGTDHSPIASGSHDWENRHENGVWTYSLEDITAGLQDCYADLVKDVQKQYGTGIQKLASIGISAMMHGYMAFDQKDELLVPFRTWRNTITEQASEELTELFGYHIPQRWSIAHLRQAIINEEPHVKEITFFTTLAGYIHWQLTGQKVLGVGDASGMFPIDIQTGNYNEKMIDQFMMLIESKNYPWRLKEILPKVLKAGEDAGKLTEAGAKLLDPSGALAAGVPLCPPEGDAGTGMAATNSVAVRTGNVSAGTSVFSMVVLEKDLSKAYPEIDLVTTPCGDLVAMVHCNNCTSDINAWMNLFKEYNEAMGFPVDMNKLYTTMFEQALKGDPDGGGLLSYCYLSGEHITGMEEGRPLLTRTPESHFTLANFMRTNLMTALGCIRIGMDILVKKEQVKVEEILGHGGFFKTPQVGQKIMAAAVGAPVSVMETAGEGGAWGIALLAAYLVQKNGGESLQDYLNNRVYNSQKAVRIEPDKADIAGFDQFIERYEKGLAIERAAVENL